MRRYLSIASFIIAFFSAAIYVDRYDMKHGKEESGRTGALEALEFYSVSRSYPFADIPADRYYKEYERVRRKIPEISSSAAGGQWQFLGPLNFSGRMTCVAVNPLNPNTIYSGSSAAGMWKSFTGGTAGDWTKVVTGYPVLGVNAIAIDPTDTNHIFIGTGEVYRYQASVGGVVYRPTRGSYGLGILESTDGGATWSKSLDWSHNQQRGVQMIRFHPTGTNTLLAATTEGIYRTTDGGTTWAQTLNVIMARDVAINPLDPNIVLATCGNFASTGTGTYRSTDGGVMFTQISALPGYSGTGRMDIYGANPNHVVLSLADSTIGNGTLWQTLDFGATWTLLSSEAVFGVQGWYSMFVAIHQSDSLRILRGGQSLFRSTNGGISSVQVPGGWADYRNYAHHPINPDFIYMVDDGGVWRSTNFGLNFTFVGNGLATSQFYNGFSASANDSLRALGQVQDHFGWMFTGTTTWPQSAVDEVGWTAIDQTNDNIMYAGSRNGGAIYKSTNRGNSFNASSSGISGGNRSWNTPFVLSPSNPNILYFGRSIVFRSSNAGASWTATNGGAALDANTPLSMAIAATDPNVVFVGTAPLNTRGHVFRTTNGGANWTDVTGPLPDRYPMDLGVDPLNSSIVYAVFGGFDSSHVFKSTDQGNNWIDITGTLPDVPATAVMVDPLNTNHVYVGTDLGVFVSTNQGMDWSSWNDGLPEAVIVSDLQISPTNRSMKLATHSAGVYERKLVQTATSVDERSNNPKSFVLSQNYPNPFNPSTTIRFNLTSTEKVSLKVFDVNGKEVGVLLDGVVEGGEHQVQFNANGLASGIYFYMLEGKSIRQVKKMTLLR